MRIAVLLLLHTWSEQQKKLVDILTTRFTVFIHVDKRSRINLNEIRSRGAHILSEYPVYWGHFNQIRATLRLFQEANKTGYDRYILISGHDLPIVSAERIEQFFAGHQEEYLEHFRLPFSNWGGNGGLDRIDYYHPKYLAGRYAGWMERIANRCFHELNNHGVKPLMKVFGKRKRPLLDLWGGSNWMNLTGTCVAQMVDWIEKNPWYVERFRFTKCADEIFFQTVIMNTVSGIRIENNSLRYVDWVSGPECPRILRKADVPKVLASGMLFARKFDEAVDKDAVETVLASVASNRT